MMITLLACNLTQATPPPLPTADLPTIEIIDPPNNRQVVEGTDFVIDMVARDTTQGISKVELFIDGNLINASSPFENVAEPIFRVQMNWLAQGIGLHSVEAIAYRPDGRQSDAALISIDVLPAP